jgi:AraC-like DNA-binding protein
MNQFENTILLLTGLVGIILIYVMITSLKSNKLVNGFLIFNFAIASARFIIISSYNLNFQDILKDIEAPYRVLLILVFPSSYFYFKAVVTDSSIAIKKISKHLLFPVLFFVFNLICTLRSPEKSTITLTINFYASLFYAIFYLYQTFQVCYKNVWNKKLAINKDHYQVMKNWTIFYYIVCVFLTFRLITSFIYENAQSYSISGNHISYVLAAIVWLLVFLRIFKTPEILYGIPNLAVKTHHFDEVKIKLSDAWNLESDEINSEKDLKLKEKLDHRIIELIQEVEFLSQEKKLFKNPKITMFDMALELGVPESHLNYLFRYHSNHSFLEYKNNMRIAYSIDLIKNGYLVSNTLESLAKDVGFASYSPFFNAFKKRHGVGPNEFLNKVSTK